MSLYHYTLMARYNAWMNRKIYDAARTLPDEVRKRDVGAFFKSLHGTLNHLVLADTMWLSRFSPEIALPISLAVIRSLDQVLVEDFAHLREVRQTLDTLILDFVKTLEGRDLDCDLVYHRVNGAQMRLYYPLALTHFFNHQTHHRGQATTILFQLGVDPGETDLPWMPAQGA